jgi:YidC/Oxa1 family membrane protein insertase
MNDIRRTILWVVFGFSMIMLWDQWKVFHGEKPLFFPGPVAAQQQASAASDTSVPKAVSTVKSVEAGIPESPTPTVAKTTHEISTDVFKVRFDSEGAVISKVELTQQKDLINPNANMVLMDETSDRVYLAQTGLISGSGSLVLPTHKTAMTLRAGATQLQEGQDKLDVVFESPEINGVKLVKTYTFKRGQYDVSVRHSVENHSHQEVNPQLYLQLVRDGGKAEGDTSFYSTFTGPAVYTEEKKYQKIKFEDIKKNKADYEKQANNGYVAMVQHYFVSAWILPNGTNRTINLDGVDIGAKTPDCCYRATTIVPMDSLKPGESKSVEATLYMGPQEEKKLEAIYPGLELVKDYGWLRIIAKPLFWLLDQLNHIIHNWGWSIVALVVLLKAAFFTLNAHAYKSMAKMKAINPRLTEVRERHKDNPQLMQAEMMKLYREEKVNPMGGCLPILIQMPVFIALYWVLSSTVEFRSESWLYIADLTRPDAAFFMLPGFNMPVGPLPLAMLLTTVLQTWLNPTPPDPMQAKLMWIMPLMFGFMFFFFPAGLVLYWLTNNILSITQQWLINKKLGVLK